MAHPGTLTGFLWISSCVCKDGEVGDGRACYGHLLHEIQRANQMGLVFLKLRAAISMLGVCPLDFPLPPPPPQDPQSWEGGGEGLAPEWTLCFFVQETG